MIISRRRRGWKRRRKSSDGIKKILSKIREKRGSKRHREKKEKKQSTKKFLYSYHFIDTSSRQYKIIEIYPVGEDKKIISVYLNEKYIFGLIKTKESIYCIPPEGREYKVDPSSLIEKICKIPIGYIKEGGVKTILYLGKDPSLEDYLLKLI